VGKKFIRLVLDSFEIKWSNGQHACLIYQPLGMSCSEFQDLLPGNKLPKELVQKSIQLLAISLVFIHENGVIHTGKFTAARLVYQGFSMLIQR
jgi:hypothetical protein